MTDLPTWAQRMAPTCRAIADLLSPHAEVVLHDLTTDTIIEVWNGFSARRSGEPSLLSELPADPREQPVIGPYEKITLDGRRLTSISAVVPNDAGVSAGLLCVNLDRSPLDRIMTALAELAAPPVGPRPPALFDRDWREQIALTVDEWCREHGVRREALDRRDRIEIVRTLEARDLFATKKAANHVASALGVSRATVYHLLREVHSGSH